MAVYNLVLQTNKIQKEKIGLVLSIGTGKTPDVPIDTLDFKISHLLTDILAIKNIMMLFVNQVS